MSRLCCANTISGFIGSHSTVKTEYQTPQVQVSEESDGVGGGG